MLKLTIVDRPADVHAPEPADDPGVYVWRDLAGRPCAYGHSIGGQHWMHWPRLASYRFDDEGGEVVAFAACAAPRGVVVDTFHRMVLPLALQRRGLEALHASAVTVGGHVVALCAVSGTGKSTLAYALSRMKGYPQWSDDAVVFEVGRTGIDAVPLPFDVRLVPDTAAELGRQPSGGARTVAERHEDPRERTPLGAICVLVRRGRHEFGADVSVSEMAGSKALAAVLEHAHCFNLTDARRKKLMLEHYLDLVDRVPVYEVRFRPGLDRLASVVDGMSQALER